ncbi:hypothetical protein Bbelb_313350 [Branchiostoma belcheri]|nr:hypothetical protein Bbelb_313350 [Branchiostoma belcheri]
MFGTAGRSRRQRRLNQRPIFFYLCPGIIANGVCQVTIFVIVLQYPSLYQAWGGGWKELAVTLSDQLLSQLYHTDDFMTACTFGTMVGRGTLIEQELFTRDTASASHFFLTFTNITLHFVILLAKQTRVYLNCVTKALDKEVLLETINSTFWKYSVNPTCWTLKLVLHFILCSKLLQTAFTEDLAEPWDL